MTRSNLTRIFTLAVVVLTTFQGMIPAMPLGNENTIILISAITMFLVSGLTAWKQALSVEISNKALLPTIIVAVVATLGGLNDLLNVLHLNETLGQWIRFGITGITMLLNLTSKTIFPTEEGKIVEQVKVKLSAPNDQELNNK